MSAKPSSVPTWATSSVYADGPTPGDSNKVNPPSGKRADGWWPDEKPPAETLNHEQNLIGQWLAYLSDGDLDGDHSIDGDLVVIQDVTIGGGLTVGGPVYHGDEELTLSASAFVPAGTTSITAPSLSDYWTFGTPPNDTIQGNVPLPAGRRIKSITWHFNKGSSASAMVMALRTRNGTTNTPVDSLSDVSSGAAFTSSTRSIDYTIAAGDAVFLRVQGGSTAHQFSHAVITFDFPAP